MRLDFSEYKKAIQPETILDIISQDLLQSMLEGFFYGEKAGILLVYNKLVSDTTSPQTTDLYILDPFPGQPPRSVAEELEQLDRGENTGATIKFINPFCIAYKQHSMRQERQCLLSDLEIARSIFKASPPDETNRIRTCPCFLGIIDWSYPITVNGSTRCVILAGQQVVGDRDEGLETIFKSIDSNADSSQREDLKRIAREVRTSTPQADDLRETFNKFAQSIQRAVDELYRVRYETAAQKVINICSQYLTESLDPDSQDRFWQALAYVMAEFYRTTGTGPFDVYVRARSRYIQTIGDGDLTPPENANYIPAHDCFEIPNNTLVPITESGRLKYIFKYKTGSPYLYKCDLGVQDGRNVSTIIVVHAIEKRKEAIKFVENFCHNLSLRTSISNSPYAASETG